MNRSSRPARRVDVTEDPSAPAPALKTNRQRRPFYAQLLGLRHIRPNAWQRALLGEGSLAVAVLLVLADLVSAWAMLALPIATALVVKAHDLLAGALGRRTPTGVPDASQGAADRVSRE